MENTEKTASIQEFFESGKNLYKLGKNSEALACFEEILKQGFNEENVSDSFFDIFDQTMDRIRLIAAKEKYADSEQISTLYDEFLMHKQKLSYITEQDKKEKVIHTQCVNMAQELIPHVDQMIDSLTHGKDHSQTPLIIGFAVGAVAASAATYYIVKKKKK